METTTPTLEHGALGTKSMTAKTTKPGFPFAETKIAVYLTKQIDALQGQKNQREIAAEIGYEKPNMISMFKRGEAKVPLDKIPLLAKALHVDTGHLFRLAMEQYWPELAEAVKSAFGNTVSENEFKLVEMVRSLSENGDPSFTRDDLREIKAIIKARLDLRPRR